MSNSTLQFDLQGDLQGEETVITSFTIPEATTGTDISIGNRSAESGRFNFVLTEGSGDVAFDNTEAHAVFASCLEERGGYWADENHGSNLTTLRSLTNKTRSEAEADALDALQPLEQANAITGISATAIVERSKGRLTVNVKWTTPSGVTLEAEL